MTSRFKHKPAAESVEARSWWAWACMHSWSDGVFHVPNERPSRAQRKLLAAEGVRAGVADYIGLVPVPHAHGFVLELKAERVGAHLTFRQCWFLNLQVKRGYRAIAAWGWEPAARAMAVHFIGTTAPLLAPACRMPDSAPHPLAVVATAKGLFPVQQFREGPADAQFKIGGVVDEQ